MAVWIPPATIPTGNPLPSSAWNNLAEDTLFLYQAPFLSITPSAAFPIGTGGYTPVGDSAIPMNTTFSNYGWTVTGGATAVCPLSGVYHFSLRVGFGNADAGGGFCLLFHNGQSIIFGSTTLLFPTFPGGIVSQSVGSGILPCNAGDTFFLAALQNSGGDVNLAPGSAQTALEAFFVGSL